MNQLILTKTTISFFLFFNEDLSSPQSEMQIYQTEQIYSPSSRPLQMKGLLSIMEQQHVKEQNANYLKHIYFSINICAIYLQIIKAKALKKTYPESLRILCRGFRPESLLG